MARKKVNLCPSYDEHWGCAVSPIKRCEGCPNANFQYTETESITTKMIDKGLEEAAEEYAGVNYDCETETDAFYHHIKTEAFKAGAKWDWEMMMEEAEECTVVDFSSYLPRPQVDIRLDPSKYHSGDKVRVIVIKEQ